MFNCALNFPVFATVIILDNEHVCTKLHPSFVMMYSYFSGVINCIGDRNKLRMQPMQPKLDDNIYISPLSCQ